MAAMCQPALAQTEEAAGTSSAQANRVDDIVVTARYVRENIQETPIAITAQTAAQLEAANVGQVSDLGTVVPNLLTIPGDSQSAGSPSISFRGVQQGANGIQSLAVPPAVAFYTDDIYHATTAGSELDFTDVDRVEVNRGPQSTLSGNASIAGSVKIYTRDPQGDGSGFVSLGYGDREHKEASGAIDVALTETLSLRASGHFNTQEGYGDRLDFRCMMDQLGTPALAGTLPYFQPDSAKKGCVIGHTGGGETSVGQVKLRWQPSPDLDILFTARKREDDLEETPEVTLGFVPACITGFIGPQPCSQSAGNQAYHRAAYNTFGIISGDHFVVPERDGGIYDTYATNCRPLLRLGAGPSGTATLPAGYPLGICYEPRKFAEHSLYSGKVTYDLTDNVTMTGIFGYTDYRNEFTQNGDQSPLGYVISHFINEDEQTSEELRFNGTLFDDRLEWVVGAFALRMVGYQNNMVSFGNVYQISSVKGINDSQSAFAHMDFRLTDRWRVSGGGRFTDSQIAITINNPQAITISDPRISAQERWDWLMSTDFKINEDILLYASAASGSRPPGLTTIVSTIRQLSPTSEEDLVSYEVGVKADLFDQRLRTNLTGFYIDYRKLSTSVAGVECRNQPGPVATWQNVLLGTPAAIAACSQFPGLSDPITFTQNVGIPAEVKGFEWEVTAIPIDGLRIDWSGGYNNFESGVTTPGAPGAYAPNNLRQPEWNMHANVSYELETPAGRFTPRLDWNWLSKQTYDPSPATGNPEPIFVIDPYSLWNAQLTYEPSDDSGWSATFRVTNLADKWHHYQVLRGGINAQTRVGPPREWMVTLRRDF